MKNRTHILLLGPTRDFSVTLPESKAQWLLDLIERSTPQKERAGSYPLLREAKTAFPSHRKEFASFLNTSSWNKVRSAGLLLM
jgi:hypothetical protein